MFIKTWQDRFILSINGPETPDVKCRPWEKRERGANCQHLFPAHLSDVWGLAVALQSPTFRPLEASLGLSDDLVTDTPSQTCRARADQGEANLQFGSSDLVTFGEIIIPIIKVLITDRPSDGNINIYIVGRPPSV